VSDSLRLTKQNYLNLQVKKTLLMVVKKDKLGTVNFILIKGLNVSSVTQK
jgi:hypothetical protein